MARKKQKAQLKKLVKQDEEMRRKHHEEDLRRLASFRPFDDTFMRVMFKDNIPLAELVLRIILKMDSLVLIRIETQADMKRVTGARSICLDAYGTDNEGKKYDIEVQRGDKGAGVRRARYHASVMDIENLDANEDFDSLPDTYVVFITENDVLGYGQPVYEVERKIKGIDVSFADGNFIVYVNGEYRGDDPLGRLMHDFSCTKADDMYYKEMADKTRYLKENPKGVEEVCRQMEELREQSAMEKAKDMAIGMYAEGMKVESIARIAKVTVKQVEAWIGKNKKVAVKAV